MLDSPKNEVSVCPHDCPSACGVEVVRNDDGHLKRLKGRKDQDYTAGVICEKVARYRERMYHPDRLLYPMKRSGPKGSGAYERITWDEALDTIAQRFLEAEAQHGPETVWPYYYAGTMGLVQRDGIHRLRHAKRYSGMFDTICTNMAWTGFAAGTGKLAGPDPREMAKADVIVIWGTNAVSTQVNVMTHVAKARKTRNAKLVVVDVYHNDTMKQADHALCLKPGTDAALACAIMHVLFRDGYADREYLDKYSDCPDELEAHLQTRGPEWASAITGLSVDEIETVAKLVGTTQRTFWRLGYGFTRSRNGTAAMHAASCIATVAGHWQYEGGGAFHTNSAIFKLNSTMIEGRDVLDRSVRNLDQSRIGAVLTGDEEALKGGPPVTAMLVQNTNPAVVAPDSARVREGLAREDLFTVVHEQFMTETAQMADIVLPATMFLEHDDIYRGGGHQYIGLGPKAFDAPGEARENHYVICELAKRLGAQHKGFQMSAREHVDWMLRNSGRSNWDSVVAAGGQIDAQPSFDEAHYVNGFAYPDGKFRFKPDWARIKAPNDGPMGPVSEMPALPDQWNVIELATADHPYRLVTPPARTFLNSTFNTTPTSVKREGRPTVMIHVDDAKREGISDGDRVVLTNDQARVTLHASLTDQTKPGTLVVEGLWPNDAFEDGIGINALTGADTVAPYGGAAFHDTRVGLTRS